MISLRKWIERKVEPKSKRRRKRVHLPSVNLRRTKSKLAHIAPKYPLVLVRAIQKLSY